MKNLPPDQVIEHTINKDQRGRGGIIGINKYIDWICPEMGLNSQTGWPLAKK